jgi:amino acid permease
MGTLSTLDVVNLQKLKFYIKFWQQKSKDKNYLCIIFVLHMCYSVLLYVQPGGSVFITTLNRTIAVWTFYIFLGEYIMGVIPQETHGLNKCCKPHETQALLEKCEYTEGRRLCISSGV